MLYTTRNSFGKSDAIDLYQATRTANNANFEALDAMVAKCTDAKALDPTTGDDTGDGYATRSICITVGHKIFMCENPSTGAAVWRQLWPPLLSDATIGSQARGDILYRGASAWSRLAKGTQGSILNMGADDPAWLALSTPGRFLKAGASAAAWAELVAADMNFTATARILGRKTAAAGDGEECTLSEILDFVGSAARGDLLTRGAATWSRLAKGAQGSIFYAGADDPAWLSPGSAGQALISNGASANPSWDSSRLDGWVAAGETWTYAAADDPTFTFTIAGDKSTKYSPGMRIKLMQTTVKYFVITKVVYSSPNTTITVYGGTDYDLVSAAITSPYYSMVKAPAGFPLDTDKWTVLVTDTADRSQASPVQNTWYNLGSISITIPIGAWRAEYKVCLEQDTASKGTVSTLSTTNNSESDADFSALMYSAGGMFIVPTWIGKHIILTAKTAYYLNCRSTDSSSGTIHFRGDLGKTIIRAICAYL